MGAGLGYRHRVCHIPPHIAQNAAEVQARLDGFSEDGWEMVGVIGACLIFKRPHIPPAEPIGEGGQ